jgi:hypothetical protein
VHDSGATGERRTDRQPRWVDLHRLGGERGRLAPGATGPDGSKLTLRSFLQLAHMLDGIGRPVTQFSIGVAPSEVVMTLYRAKYGPYQTHLRMALTGHGWAIDFIDRI